MDKKNLKRKSSDSLTSSNNSNSNNNGSNILKSPSSPKSPNNNNNNNKIFKNKKKHRKSFDRVSDNNNNNNSNSNSNSNKNNNNNTNSPSTKASTTTTTTTTTTSSTNTFDKLPTTLVSSELLPNNIKVESVKESNSNTNSSNSNDIDMKDDENKVVRVYADGIYDLFHFGHARSLQQAKLLFKNTYLIVGVCNDEITHKLKGKTVMNGEERAESLRHCRWVDEVVEDAPWIVTQEFIDQHNIDYVAHGEDLCLDKDGNDIYQFVKDQGKFKTIKRTDGISTSDIILRIVKDYDSYVMRNLSRGYTGKQMNVGVLKEKSLQFEEKINQIKSKVKLWSDQTENNIYTFLQRFSKRIPMNWDKKLLLSPSSPTDSISSITSGGANGLLSDDDDDDDDDQTTTTTATTIDVNLSSSSTPTSPSSSKQQIQTSPSSPSPSSFVISGLPA